MVSVLKAHAAVTREQKSTLARVLEGFIHVLRSSSDIARRVITAGAWDAHGSWGRRMGGLATMVVVQTLLLSDMNNIFRGEGVS